MPTAGRLSGLALAFALLFGPGAIAEAAGAGGDLYRATVLVTGQDEEGRGPAIARAFRAVLVKVSGDPRLGDDAGAIALAGKAMALVGEFSYRDLMAGIPVHDEQGSRDRPYALTVSFDPDGIDSALKSIGVTAWPDPRPMALVVVAIRTGSTGFTLASDGAKGRDMREALDSAGEQFGLTVTLPSTLALAEVGTSTSDRAAPEPETLAAVAGLSGADVAITGTLVWIDAELGWAADWQMTTDNGPYRWQARRVSFDDAFRSAIGGAAGILSGHGAPN